MPIVLLIAQFLPLILQLIQDAEVAFSGKPGASGKAKKALVMDGLAGGMDLAGKLGVKGLEDPKKREAIHGAAGQLVDGVVNTLNAAGWAETAGGPNEG